MLRQKAKAKQFLPLIMVIIMAVSFIGSDVFTVNAKAASKWDGYTKISSVEDLQLLKSSSENFYLTKDIDLKDIKDWEPINYFFGILDGNGYAIKNLKSTKGGLFKNLRGAKIKNLGLLNVDINFDGMVFSVGALANYSDDDDIYHSEENEPVLVENCYVTGKVTNSASAAGFIGSCDNTEFKDCINFAEISNAVSCNGIAGSSSNYGNGGSYIGFKNCINLGKITAKNSAAGIAYGTLGNADFISCYNVGKVTNTGKKSIPSDLIFDPEVNLDSNGQTEAVVKDCGYIGDYAYSSYYSSLNRNSYKVAVKLFDNGSKKMTKSELKKQETYVSWDFDKVWYMDSKINNGYPILQIMLRNYNASKPVSDTESGEYKKGTKINLSTELEGVTIYYTTNGKAPTTSSTKHTGAITVSKDTAIKAAVFTNKGKIRGKVETFTYKFK